MRSSRFIVVGVGLALAVAVVLLVHQRYPMGYIYEVFVDQDADYEDVFNSPSQTIASSKSPAELPEAQRSDIPRVFEQHPDVTDFEAFLRETETSALVVLHRGRLVGERYLLNNNRGSFQNTFSVAKAVTSALIGMAIRDSLLSLPALVTELVPELRKRDARFDRINIGHLLDMRSGIRYSGNVSFPFVTSDDPLIYYHPDLESVVLERTEIAAEPGDFHYNNYNPPLLGLVLRRATGMAVSEYLERNLWDPLGAEYSAGWTVDDRGFERMESGFFARARDLAKLGQLYLVRGRAGGRQIISEDWVDESTQLGAPLTFEEYDGRRWVYRYGWWIVPRPDGRPDFCAIGRFGQYIYVSPQHEAVFVRNGPGRGSRGDRDWTELFYFVAERLEPSALES